ncbi:ParB/RepB/Spo0J family partition protein [Pseudomonas sp. Hg5Tf]|uniref:ParB/RepB/Spo0J family partition protein n=1 Tax=Pseudomonas sp. Hg7Tf TaxID=3236988 RepID=A0AB39HQV1_9PSED
MTEKQNSFGRVVKATAQKLSDFQKRPAINDGSRVESISPGEIECVKQIRRKDNPGFSQESLEELAKDILANGQIEPCVLRPHPNPESGYKFLMVAGERRYRACIIAGVLVQSVVKELTDAQAKRIQRSENVHSENLSQLDIALALKESKEELGTLEKVAEDWSKSINWVAERLAYLENVTRDGASREAVTRGVTADISTVNDIGRLERLDPQAAADLVQRAEDNLDLNLRQEVRSTLRNTKALRVHNGGSKKSADKGGPQASTQQTLLDDQLGKLREANTVLEAQVKTLSSENTYLKAELEEARKQLAERWKDSE